MNRVGRSNYAVFDPRNQTHRQRYETFYRTKSLDPRLLRRRTAVLFSRLWGGGAREVQRRYRTVQYRIAECFTLLFVMRRVGEAVHARHYQQYKREVQEARDGDDDEHFVGRVAHAGRGGVHHDVWLRTGRRRGVVTMVVSHLHRAVGGPGFRPQARRRHLVVSPVVPDGAPIAVTTAAAVATPCTAAADRASSVVVVHRVRFNGRRRSCLLSNCSQEPRETAPLQEKENEREELEIELREIITNSVVAGN